jgi:GMP synthase (glutamine-hydrolysing)
LTPTATKRADVIRHTPLDDLGAFRPVLERAGYAINIIEPFHDDVTVLDAEAADLMVVLGGAIGVHDAGTYPFLTDEIRCLARASAGRSWPRHRARASTGTARSRSAICR